MHLRGLLRELGRAAPLALLVACTPEQGYLERSNVDTWQQAPTNEVDILFVVDNSHSMVEEQAAVAAGFDDFIAEIVATGTEFHLAAVSTSFAYDDPLRGQLLGTPKVLTPTTPDYAGLFRQRVQVGTTGSDKEKGLEVAEYALSPSMTLGSDAPNAGFLRPDAHLLLVIVSDENDCSDEGALEGMTALACYDEPELLVPVDEYVAFFAGLKDDTAKVHVGAIVGPRQADAGACQEATPGVRYMEFAAAFGGVVGNICTTDYGDVLSQLGDISSGIVQSFQLSDPAQPDSILVTVATADGVETEVPMDATNGWTYDEATSYLTFHGAAIPPRGSTISARYDLASL